MANQKTIKDTGKNSQSTLPIIEIQNRKYLGCKYRLMDFLISSISQRVPRIESFGDLFCGTGVVSFELCQKADSVLANDMLYSSFVTCQAFFGPQTSSTHNKTIADLLGELNRLPGSHGYFSQTFGGNYFTLENASKIDSVREKIAIWEREGKINQSEKWQLLTSLIYGADKAANIVGQYDAFMKNMGDPVYNTKGKHLVDVNVYRPLQLGIPKSRPMKSAKILQRNANDIIGDYKFHVLYLDPPYNNRQYIDLYHVLENLALWHKPEVFGKTRKFERRHLKSNYSRKRQVARALQDLISRANAEHIFLSYNNEGILSQNDILRILSCRGPVERIEENYPVFGKGAGQSRSRCVKEQLYYLKPIHRVKK